MDGRLIIFGIKSKSPTQISNRLFITFFLKINEAPGPVGKRRSWGLACHFFENFEGLSALLTIIISLRQDSPRSHILRFKGHCFLASFDGLREVGVLKI